MFVFLVCLVLTALCVDAGGYIQSGLYNNYQGEYAGAYDNYQPRAYSFEYGVSDPHTGDHKSQWETKGVDGVVRGSYSLLESDGSTRVVDYVADDHGFRAVVKKIGLHGHPESIESHGGAVEETHGFNPIVVAEPEFVHVEQPQHGLQNTLHLEPTVQPVHAQQPVHVQQPVYVQQPAHYQPPIHTPEIPVFHSYDGGIEDYQNVFNQQPYHFQIPKAEEVYREVPNHNTGYIEQPYGAQRPIYLEQPYVPQAYPAQQPQFVPNQDIATHSYAAPQEQLHVQQGLLPPRTEGFYTQQNQHTQSIGQGEASYPHQYIANQGQASEAQTNQIHIDDKLAETYQNHQQYPASTGNNVDPYQVKLPVESYHLEQSFPGHNQVLLDTSRQYGGSENALNSHGISLQGYQGITGNLQDDSQYTNYGNHRAAEVSLNQGEYVPQATHYSSPVPLPLQHVQGHQPLHK